MKKSTLISLSIAVASVFSANVFAVDFYVSPTGNDGNSGSQSSPFQTVEKAAEMTQEGVETTVYLEANATFMVGRIDFLNNKKVSLIGKNTTLKAAEKPGKEGGEGSRILRAGSGTEMKVKGITFENGRQVEYLLGGAIFLGGTLLEVDSCRFINNEAGACGGAIGSRGKTVIVRNSYFEGNYIIGGGGRGAAITQAGNSSITGTSLVVENCTFYKNNLSEGGSGSAIAIMDPAINTSKVDNVEITNCTFVENTSKDGYQAAIHTADNPEADVYIINNTFYKNDGAFRINFVLSEKVFFINNLVYAEKAGILSETSIATGRLAIIAYNNIIIGKERGVNEKIDDESLTTQKATYNNIVDIEANYPITNVGLATTLSMDNFVPYLTISATGEAANKGMDNSATVTGSDMIPTKDNVGKTKSGIRDIGAYEALGTSGIFSPAAVADFFEIYTTDNNVTIVNTANNAISLKIVDITGRAVYNDVIDDSITIAKGDIAKGVVVLIFTDGNKQKAKKMIF